MVSRLARSGFVPAVGIAVVLTLSACGSQKAPGIGPGGIPDGSSARPATTAAPGPMRPLTKQAVAADGALQCPASIADQENMTVPQKPQGLDGNARLLPDRAPESIVVCRYPILDITALKGAMSPPYRLDGRVVVPDESVAEVVELMTWAPRGNGIGKVCTAIGGDSTGHLLGARYSDAIVWVAAQADPNACANATNGDFVSRAAVGMQLDRMFGRDATKPNPLPTEPCGTWSTGRLGDDVSLAPEGDPVVTVCRTASTGDTRPTSLDPAQSAQVIDALRSLSTQPSGNTCADGDPAADDNFRLALTYKQGPRVHIAVSPTCTPPVLGGGLQATGAGNLVTLVEQWSAPIPGPDKDGSVSSDNRSSSGQAPDAPVAPGSPGLPTEAPPATGSGVPVPPASPVPTT